MYLQDWEKISSTKAMNRFRPPQVAEAVQRMELAKERLQAQAEKDYHTFLSSFASLYMPFRSAVSALAALDALQSLALISHNSGCVFSSLGSFKLCYLPILVAPLIYKCYQVLAPPLYFRNKNHSLLTVCCVQVCEA
jgi:hypothetical protein